MQEQLPVLNETGAALARDVLIACFGQASGSRQGFRFVIAETAKTDHAAVNQAIDAALRDSFRTLHDGRLRLSLDDTGCGFFDLKTVETMRPEVVKLCITVISRININPGIEAEMQDTVQAVNRLGGLVLGEGVENAQQADVLTRCGAAHAQGYFYSRPRPANKLFVR